MCEGFGCSFIVWFGLRFFHEAAVKMMPGLEDPRPGWLLYLSVRWMLAVGRRLHMTLSTEWRKYLRLYHWLHPDE